MKTEPILARRPRTLWIGGILLMLAILGITRGILTRPETDTELTFAVRRGPLVISFTESGTVQAQSKIIIKNEIPGRTTILWAIDEGAVVKEGDLLIELDSSQLEEDLFSQQLKVQNAEAAFIKSREDLEILKSQTASDIEKAETELLFAEQDLEAYISGEYPQKLREAEVRITLAEEDLSRAEETLKWSKVLFEKKYISQSELQADELSTRKMELDLEVARGQKELLEKHTHARTLAELKSGTKQSAMSLDRVKRKATANLVQAEADFSVKQAEQARQRSKLEDVQAQIKATRVIAPADGQVVYASSTERRHWRNDTEPLAAGVEVREQQDLIHLPDNSRMMAAIKVNEAHIKKVSKGMPARITVDAMPGTHFTASVESIAPLPDANASWLTPDLKVYNAEVYIEEGAKGLRSGMTCSVEIVIEIHDNAIYIPVQAVVRIKDIPTVYVVGRSGKQEPRAIRVGNDNGRMIVVQEGLEEGEHVLLSPPLRDSDRQDTRERLPEDISREDGQPKGRENASRPEGAKGRKPRPNQSRKSETPRGSAKKS